MTFVYILSKVCPLFKANQANVPSSDILSAVLSEPRVPQTKPPVFYSGGTPLSLKAANGNDR